MSSATSSPDEVVKKRWLGFLIWQSIASTVVYLLPSLLFPFPRRPLAASVLSFLAFHLSLLLLSLSLFFLSSPRPDPSASITHLSAAFLRTCLRTIIGGAAAGDFPPDFRRLAGKALAKCFFLLICGISGFLSTAAVYRGEVGDGGLTLVGVGINGTMFGLVYGIHYLFHKRWILKFPIIQRPFFYSFKIGLSSSLKQALKVVHTRRCRFAPSRGSAAAETNPSEVLLEALEQSRPKSLLQYLAYLDLCMVSECNVEPWRRAAFFEETGETYRRVISLCLRPLEQLTSMLVEGLEGLTLDKSDFFSQQLNPPTGPNGDPKLQGAFNDLQLYSWCARAVAALTAWSHSEDRYGVAQLTGCNISVVSTLLSTLVAVEACMGKKTSSQPAHMMGPASIRWVTPSTARHDGVLAVARRKRSGMLHAKAYAMADVLRTSIYQIVNAFQADMQAGAKSSALEKNWIATEKPLYGTRETIIQKLHQFLAYRA